MIPRGMQYMALAAFWFSVMSVLVKLGGQTLPSPMLVLARAIVTLVLSGWSLWREGVSPRGVRRGLLAVRGGVGFVALTCFYYSLTHLPLADATIIQYTNPALTAGLAAWLLKERLTLRTVAGLSLALGGAAVIMRPSFLAGGGSGYDPLALAAAGAAAALAAVAYVTVRKLRETDHPMVVVFWFPLVAVPGILPLVIPVWRWPSPWEWLLMLGVGVATQIAQVFMTKGLFLEQAGRATSVSYLQIVFAFGWGVLLFREPVDGFTFAGAAMVLSGTAVVAARRTSA